MTSDELTATIHAELALATRDSRLESDSIANLQARHALAETNDLC